MGTETWLEIADQYGVIVATGAVVMMALWRVAKYLGVEFRNDRQALQARVDETQEQRIEEGKASSASYAAVSTLIVELRRELAGLNEVSTEARLLLTEVVRDIEAGTASHTAILAAIQDLRGSQLELKSHIEAIKDQLSRIERRET